MSTFLITPKQFFKNKALGTSGSFRTPAGTVQFVLTKARLGPQDSTPESRLTRLLIPAREALTIKDMDFSQLLQRDLDDHRIATDLVPYVLRPELNGPAFFPPILAVLLPFAGRRAINEMHLAKSEQLQDDPEYPGTPFNWDTYGEFFRFQSACDAEGRNTSSGVLRWNDERAKLIIVDGQHRAMALIAIDRTYHGTWSESSGERYKPFYEERVRELLKKSKKEGQEIDLSSVEFPVTICWFPEYTGPNHDPHKAARKLFVDVNQNAKKPSESRLILLSDTELDNMFARDLLSRQRDSEPFADLPLYCIEYDNPDQSPTPRRWSVVTNLEILRAIVQRTVFGPEESITRVDRLLTPRGKPNEIKMGQHMRLQLDLLNFMPAKISDGPREIERSDISRKHFPVYNYAEQRRLLDRFFDTWGKGILLLLSEVLPYKQHIQAIKGIYNGWNTGGSSTGELAKEALFDGVGMFWTLEDGHILWREQVRSAQQGGGNPPVQPEVSKAWQLVWEVKSAEFHAARAQLYLGSSSSESVTLSPQIYLALNTYAAQLGLAMTWATLRNKFPAIDGTDLARVMVTCINRALETGPIQSRDRKAIFAKEYPDLSKAFNKLPKMDTQFASYFRYFWLELLTLEENRPTLDEGGLDSEVLASTKRLARLFYLQAIADKNANSYKDSQPTWDQTKREDEAKKATAKDMARAYRHWFGIATSVAETELLGDLIRGRKNWMSSAIAANEELMDSEPPVELGMEDEGPSLETADQELAQEDFGENL